MSDQATEHPLSETEHTPTGLGSMDEIRTAFIGLRIDHEGLEGKASRAEVKQDMIGAAVEGLAVNQMGFDLRQERLEKLAEQTIGELAGTNARLDAREQKLDQMLALMQATARRTEYLFQREERREIAEGVALKKAHQKETEQ